MSSPPTPSDRRPLVIGAVIVSHGMLARELLEATQRIVGPTQAIVAVTLDWDDEVTEARRQIRAGIDVVDGGAGVLIFTEMFGGTPTNVSLAFLQAGKVEVVTGVNLPMLVKLTSLQTTGLSLAEAARQLRDRGRNSIHVASEILESQEQA